MWPWGTDRVTCIACGTSLPRADAREYDKYGDRWDREDKAFEHLCKPCDRRLCRHSRPGLESLLVELEAGEHSQAEFCSRYVALVEQRYGRPEEPGRRD